MKYFVVNGIMSRMEDNVQHITAFVGAYQALDSAHAIGMQVEHLKKNAPLEKIDCIFAHDNSQGSKEYARKAAHVPRGHGSLGNP